jgi:hypothetical protein
VATAEAKAVAEAGAAMEATLVICAASVGLAVASWAKAAVSPLAAACWTCCLNSSESSAFCARARTLVKKSEAINATITKIERRVVLVFIGFNG